MSFQKRRTSLPTIPSEIHSTFARRNTVFICERSEMPTFKPKRRRNQMSTIRVKLDTVFNHFPQKPADTTPPAKLPKLDLGTNLDVDSTIKLFSDYHKTNVLSKFFISILTSHENTLTHSEIEKLYILLNQVEKMYLDNAYHNAVHALDVLATTEVLLNILEKKIAVIFDHRFAILMAAACHDIAHPGVTSDFIKSYFPSKSEKFETTSGLLEQMHAQLTFQLLVNSDIGANKYRDFDLIVKTSILATDMSKHQNQIEQVALWLGRGKKVEVLEILPILLHAADIFNPIKDFENAMFWGRKVFTEMETQEHVTNGLNRIELTDMNPVKLQIGFIKFFVRPFFESFSKLIDCPEIMDRLEENFVKFSKLDK